MVCFIEFIQSNAAELLAASGPSPSSVPRSVEGQNYMY